MEWWHWLVLGVALCAAELAVPAFVLIWIGLSALALSLLTFLFDVSLTYQLLLWAILSSALVVLWLRVFKPTDHKTRAGTSQSMVGEIGLLVRGVEPFQQGQVLFQRPLLGADRWDCVSERAVAAGTRVRVVGVEGSTLKIELAEG